MNGTPCIAAIVIAGSMRPHPGRALHRPYEHRCPPDLDFRLRLGHGPHMANNESIDGTTLQKQAAALAPDEIPAIASLRRIAESNPDRPFVVAQLGQSLDGRIATPGGESRYINAAAGLDHLHRLRACVDAVVVGAGTIEADDPELTVRRCAGRNPARIVVDPRSRLDWGGRWLARDGARRVLVTSNARVAPPGVETVALPADSGAIAPHEIILALHRLGFARILVEGGARTVSSFIDAGAIDRLHLIVACMIIGSGRTGLDLRPLLRLGDALRPPTEVCRLGERDVLFDCDLRAAAERE